MANPSTTEDIPEAAAGKPSDDVLLVTAEGGEAQFAGGKVFIRKIYLNKDRFTPQGPKDHIPLKTGDTVAFEGTGLGVFNRVAFPGQIVLKNSQSTSSSLVFSIPDLRIAEGGIFALTLVTPDGERLRIEPKVMYFRKQQEETADPKKDTAAAGGKKNEQEDGKVSDYDPTGLMMKSMETAIGGVVKPFLPNALAKDSNRKSLIEALKQGDKKLIKEAVEEAESLGNTEGLNSALKFAKDPEDIKLIQSAISKAAVVSGAKEIEVETPVPQVAPRAKIEAGEGAEVEDVTSKSESSKVSVSGAQTLKQVASFELSDSVRQSFKVVGRYVQEHPEIVSNASVRDEIISTFSSGSLTGSSLTNLSQEARTVLKSSVNSSITSQTGSGSAELKAAFKNVSSSTARAQAGFSGSASMEIKARLRQNLTVVGKYLLDKPELIVNAQSRAEILPVLSSGNFDDGAIDALSPQARSDLQKTIQVLSDGSLNQPGEVAVAANQVLPQLESPEKTDGGEGSAEGEIKQTASVQTQPQNEAQQPARQEKRGQEGGKPGDGGGSVKKESPQQDGPQQEEGADGGGQQPTQEPVGKVGAIDGVSLKPPAGFKMPSKQAAALLGKKLGDINKKKGIGGEMPKGKPSPLQPRTPPKTKGPEDEQDELSAEQPSPGDEKEEGDRPGSRPFKDSSQSGLSVGDLDKSKPQGEKPAGEQDDSHSESQSDEPDQGEGEPDDEDEAAQAQGDAASPGALSEATAKAAKLVNEFINDWLLTVITGVWVGGAFTVGIGIILGAIIGDFLWAFKRPLIKYAVTHIKLPLLEGDLLKNEADNISDQIKFSSAVKANIVIMNLIVGVGLFILVIFTGGVMWGVCNNIFVGAAAYLSGEGAAYSEVCGAINKIAPGPFATPAQNLAALPGTPNTGIRGPDQNPTGLLVFMKPWAGTDPYPERDFGEADPKIDSATKSNLTDLKSSFDAISLSWQESGRGVLEARQAYRPQAYQSHYRTVWEIYAIINNKDNTVGYQCEQVTHLDPTLVKRAYAEWSLPERQALQEEFNRHAVSGPTPAGCISDHASGIAIDITPPAGELYNQLIIDAQSHGLCHNIPGDAPHFALKDRLPANTDCSRP